MDELEDLKALLSTSPWFDSVEADRDSASLRITIHEEARTPYHHLPGHSGAMLILALVIPIPWQSSTGYRLTAMSSGSPDAVVVDTRRESTAVLGTLAPLFNFHPDLSFSPSAERELDQIHAQLLPLVERR